jgi:hypothetical protein
MTSKDQQLLEEAYQQILIDEKIGWKGALTAAALAALNLIGGPTRAQAAPSLEFEPKNDPIEYAQQAPTAEDLLPHKEYEEVLDILRQVVAKGDLKSAKQIYNILNQTCTEAAMKVRSSDEVRKIAAMDAKALDIWNDAYLGVFKSAAGAMTDAARASAR